MAIRLDEKQLSSIIFHENKPEKNGIVNRVCNRMKNFQIYFIVKNNISK